MLDSFRPFWRITEGLYHMTTPSTDLPEAGPIEVAVSPENNGLRLDRVLAGAVPNLSRSRLQGLVREGAVSCDGVTIGDPGRRVKPGERYTIVVPEPEPALPAPEAIALAIVYEDEHLIIVDKPAGLVVHPAAGVKDGTLVNGLLARFPQLVGVGDPRRPGIVHRLDRGTSGLMVVARTGTAHRSLSAAIRRREVKRSYQALVLGHTSAPRGTIDAPIGIDPFRPSKRKVVPDGKASVTHYRVVEQWDAVTLLDVDLDTGRTHQIRVHLSSIGLPVVGDKAYGRPGPVASPRIFLHAARLAFQHPLDENEVAFESPLPDDLAAVLDQLKNV